MHVAVLRGRPDKRGFLERKGVAFPWDKNWPHQQGNRKTGLHCSVFFFFQPLVKNISPWVQSLVSQLIKSGIDVISICVLS